MAEEKRFQQSNECNGRKKLHSSLPSLPCKFVILSTPEVEFVSYAHRGLGHCPLNASPCAYISLHLFSSSMKMPPEDASAAQGLACQHLGHLLPLASWVPTLVAAHALQVCSNQVTVWKASRQPRSIRSGLCVPPRRSTGPHLSYPSTGGSHFLFCYRPQALKTHS